MISVLLGLSHVSIASSSKFKSGSEPKPNDWEFTTDDWFYKVQQQVFLKCVFPGLFFVYFRLFRQTLQYLQQINVKNFHPVYSAGFRTHDLWNTSLVP